MVATDGMVEDDTDAVDIVQPTAKLIGLTKEQLEQYRNDPFWKAIRYSLFVAFWLVWLAMFVGAILIVVLSPKCHQVNWTEKMVAYKVFTLAYSDSKNGIGDFATVGKKLEDLKNIGVSAIWPTPVLKYYKNALGPEAIEKLEVSDQLGGVDAFKDPCDGKLGSKHNFWRQT
uniref:SLC3A2_N domain-containing protein n=1 Tax=Globodera pallida TaxID=36090 RepID=A0A183CK17_GLOPA